MTNRTNSLPDINRPVDVVGTASLRTISLALDALRQLEARFLDHKFRETFDAIVHLIARCEGRVILAGVGKSGLVSRKITATLLSTGTPAAFLHPTDAGHGDLGMISSKDIVLIMSSSGETVELRSITNYCKRHLIPLVAITKAKSTLAKTADLSIHLPPVIEACSHDLSPTTSTTLQIVFGDALAIALMDLRGFTAEDFHGIHPRGRLGAHLSKVRDIMVVGRDIPIVHPTASLIDATIEMTRARLGGTAIVDENRSLLGVFTDGDLRRTAQADVRMTSAVGDHMSRNPRWIGPDEAASEALRRLLADKVLLLFVCDPTGLIGAIHMHDLVRAGVA